MRQTIRSLASPAVRLGIVLAAAFALIASQGLVALTHAPSAAADERQAVGHGHVHDTPDDAGFAGHDATDHEHQFHAVQGEPRQLTCCLSGFMAGHAAAGAAGLIRDGPRRPSRLG